MTEVDLQLLGNTIRSYRERAQPKKISQFRLATRMKWEGTAPIVEIEKGRRRPRPETLNALGEALQLGPADIAYLHGLAGYRKSTVMPPLEQIKRVLQAVEPDIGQRPYPVYVMDYQFHFWMINSATAAFQGGARDHLVEILTRQLDGLTLSFDSRVLFDPNSIGNDVMERETLFRFKAYNLYRRYEPFYLAYPDCMQDRLLPGDYARFVQRWREVNVNMEDMYPITPKMVHHNGSEELFFNVHIVDIVHLDRLLFAAFYEPKDDIAGNRERCEAYFTRYSPQERFCVCAWDY